ncbi:Signal transduction protein [Giardia duodenalis]|uniref:Signal transduction protein n=1 Tax=Giardia intestinalis (strain ATCC 50803 / WB clone C6) TaxID=184922 RepID=A8BRM2_GIAIC|nr:Signal transduction protein [Giardia intestinalis]KAE8305979.1 Signal transduction protein [Giardia intestinalis]|eukprot:XP_001705300.1 Hypothetical protein GL50803_27147 [Giardia lamblia ATCC 50803]
MQGTDSSDPLYYTSPDLAIGITGFTIRNPSTGKIYFNRNTASPDVGQIELLPDVPPTNGICYILPTEFLRASAIACQIVITNRGDEPISGIKIVEEHILQGVPLQRYDFDLMFLAPRTQNTWETLYEPEFKRGHNFEEQALAGPWIIITSLYISDKLMLRNRAQLKFQ